MSAHNTSSENLNSPNDNPNIRFDDILPTPKYCGLPLIPIRVLNPFMDSSRASLILLLSNKWVNGTILHYYFFDRDTDGRLVTFTDGSTGWRTWTTTEAEKNVVREAFSIWKNVGIGLEFKEVDSRDEAEIRIGFMRGDGAWSYVGRDIIDVGVGVDERTMNFGWDLTADEREIDTAIHEIGHTLGFPHEHQNPNAGIVWDEEAVYQALASPPNNWDREKTYHNIIRKISPDLVQGSSWDPDSVMHYPFGPGLIKEPAIYQNGISPAGGLSDRDSTWVKTFYPPSKESDITELKVAQSEKLNLKRVNKETF